MTTTTERTKTHLQTLGRIHPDGYTRNGQLHRCPTCNRLTLRALDADIAALNVTADMAPLNAVGELTALLSNRMTFTLRRINGHYRIDIRWPETIRAHPAGTQPDINIVCEHVCGKPIKHTAPDRITIPTPASTLSDLAPF